MKKGIIIAAAVLVAAAAVISYKAYKRNVYWDMMTANSNAKTVYNYFMDWCDSNRTEMSALADEYRGGKIYHASDGGDGFANYLRETHEEGDKYFDSIVDGYIYVGVRDDDGADEFFTQWSKKQSGGITGQYPFAVFIDDYGTDTKDKVQFGIFSEK